MDIIIKKDLRRSAMLKNAVIKADRLNSSLQTDDKAGFILNHFTGKQFKGRSKSRFPCGRRPLVILDNLDYGLDLNYVDEEGEDIAGDDIQDEDMCDFVKGRKENYQRDSFVMEDGYLSEDECVETPQKSRRELIVKQRAASERKKKKQKFEKLGEPEVTGVLFLGGKGTVRAPFRKWKGIVFEGQPIPTGLSVNSDIQRQLFRDFHSGKHSSKAVPELTSEVNSIINKCMTSLSTSDRDRNNKTAGSVLMDRSREELSGGVETPPVLPPPSINRLSSVDPTGLQPHGGVAAGQNGSGVVDNKEGHQLSYALKYRVKYAIKKQVNQALQKRKLDDAASGSSSSPLCPAKLLKIVSLEEDLENNNRDLIIKYVNKYYFKHTQK